MKNLFIGVLLTILCSSAFAQQYSKVRIELPNDAAKKKLWSLPVAADHGSWRGTSIFETDLREDEISMIRASGIDVEIVIEDVSAFYAERSKVGPENPKAGGGPCGQATDEIVTPSQFSLGGMGGFITYAEYLGHLDNMASLYPDLITAKQPISTFQTAEGRSIYWVRISDNATMNEAEPEVLYTALHHAREAVSLSQLIFYMYYVLENYNSDPAIKQIVDNTEMYFIPMVNPDGYAYNESIQPNGGGMWRKNRRPIGGGVYGVDLNRNYSYEWGASGASSDPTSDVYKGTTPMSEPETQAMEWFTQQHTFVTAINFHSYADQLLFPWGFTDGFQCPEHNEYMAITEQMVSSNGYLNQQSSLLYPAAGDSDDWGYGETGTKPRIYSMTCEVGGNSDGFWPSQSNIIPLCKENVMLNLTLAQSASNYAAVTDLEPQLQAGSGYFSYQIQRLGWQGGSFTVSIDPIQGISSVGSSNTHTGLAIAEAQEDSIQFTLDAGLNTGDLIVYAIDMDNGIYVSHDTLVKIYGAANPLFSNGGSPTSDWNFNNSWALTTSTFVSSPNSFTDSPNGEYSDNTTSILQTVEPIDLSNMSEAFLTFSAKWEIETGWDYAQVSASTNGFSWTPLCGNYTVIGNENQNEGQPVYDGFQTDWIEEEMSLNSFLGGDVYLQFKMTSDGYVTEDGIYIDDIEVIGVPDVTVSSTVERSSVQLQIHPNPSNGNFSLTLASNADVRVYNANGKLTHTETLPKGKHSIDGSNWKNGLFLIKVETGNEVVIKRLVIQN